MWDSRENSMSKFAGLQKELRSIGAVADLARLEESGDVHGVAAAYLLDGDFERMARLGWVKLHAPP